MATRAFPGLAYPGSTYPAFAAGGKFKPPKGPRKPYSREDRLFMRLKFDTGLTLLKWPDGSYQTVENVSDDQIEQASIVYLGGHEYDVSVEEAVALTAAGYEVTDYA
jgi:hypothetical protein